MGNSLTVIPALPEDRMSYVFGRLRTFENRAVVAMPCDNEDGYEFGLFWPATAERVVVAEEDDTITMVHEESTVEMFFEYLQTAHTIVIEKVAARFLCGA
ncbi:hypothetical protein [Pseudonocardia kongjuensis]|uniref:hypothetical protein n=1 Tax=Pseudonocardia kongjuensis TaxID=102227 RepID=UPI0031D8CD09